MKSHKLLIVSKNSGKLREIRDILKGLPIDLHLLSDMNENIVLPDEGNNYEVNARNKAMTASRFFNIPAIADDSGIEIDFLDGAPGPLSARFGGENISDDERNFLILEKLKNIPREKRGTRFRCIIAFSAPGQPCLTTEAVCEGIIAEKPAGNNGFGYDPIFYIPSKKRTFAEISQSEKNKISHRGKALRKARKLVEEFILKDR